MIVIGIAVAVRLARRCSNGTTTVSRVGAIQAARRRSRTTVTRRSNPGEASSNPATTRVTGKATDRVTAPDTTRVMAGSRPIRATTRVTEPATTRAMTRVTHRDQPDTSTEAATPPPKPVAV